ncbi:hypothetical protein VNO77_08404 [Canavalia gladiata]|uniref:Uncharacterized protein n=1 Tax=Canavalia gladiata TaxID=3824 RepID=A0AAN9R113_CANGL
MLFRPLCQSKIVPERRAVWLGYEASVLCILVPPIKADPLMSAGRLILYEAYPIVILDEVGRPLLEPPSLPLVFVSNSSRVPCSTLFRAGYLRYLRVIRVDSTTLSHRFSLIQTYNSRNIYGSLPLRNQFILRRVFVCRRYLRGL